jgi:hypothetical protein
MALDFRYLNPVALADGAEEFDVNPHWEENVVTALATALAVMVVATIALLIGMA